MCPPPAPRSSASASGRLTASGMKLVVIVHPLTLLAGREVIGLAVEAALEVTTVTEHKIDVLVEIDHHGRIGHRDVARRRPGRSR